MNDCAHILEAFMSHFKAPNGSLHFLDDDSFVHLLPTGATKITDEEAAFLRAEAAKAPPGRQTVVDPPGVLRFRAFYVSPQSWVGEAVNLPYPPTGHPLPALGEVVFSFETTNVRLRACRDGMVMIDLPSLARPPATQLEKLVEFIGAYVAHMNAFFILLDSAIQATQGLSILEIREITRADTCGITYMPGQPIPSMAAGGFSAAMTQASYRFNPPGAADMFWIHQRQVISIASIEMAAVSLDAAIAIKGAVETLASLAKATAEYKIGSYNLALIIAWFIVESVARQLWENKLDELRQAAPSQTPRINAERLKYLVGNAFGVAAITNSLELLGVLSTTDFLSIDSVRQKRNKITHAGSAYVATAVDAQDAIVIASKLTERFFGVAVTPNLGYSISY